MQLAYLTSIVNMGRIYFINFLQNVTIQIDTNTMSQAYAKHFLSRLPVDPGSTPERGPISFDFPRA